MRFINRTIFAFSSVALALAGGLLSGGCGNNPYPPGESDQAVLYRVLGDDPKTLDPSVTYTVDESQVADLVYPSFYRYNYLKRDPYLLEPNLGAEEPTRDPVTLTVKDDKGEVKTVQGERVRFKIRPDIRFADDACFAGGKGRNVTAADFVYTFKRLSNPETKCPVASFFEDKVLDWKSYSAAFEKGGKSNYDAPWAGVQVDPNDKYAFIVTLTQPYPQLRFLMAMHFTTPLSREAIEKYGPDFQRDHLVGCGPYRMTEYKHKQRIVLEKNPNWINTTYPTDGMPGDKEQGLLADAGKSLPLTPKIVFNIIKEGVTSWNLFQQGYLDAAGVSNSNYQQVVSKAGTLSDDMKRRGIKLRKDTQVNINYLAFNMADPVLGGYTPEKKKLRQAISLSIDGQAFIDLFNQGNGKVAQFIIPPGVFGFDPSYKNPYRQYDADLVRAKQLLKEAGYPDGVDPKTGEKLTINYDNSATTAAGRQLVGLVIKQIERLGIHVVSQSTRYNIFQEKLDKGNFQFFYYGWLADYPDPENFVFLLYGPNVRPGPNACGYNSPAYNKAFEAMRSMPDGPARMAEIVNLRAIAQEDCPWIYINHDEDLSISYDWLKNVKGNPIANDTSIYRSVDYKARAERQKEWNQPNYAPLAAFIVALIAGAIPAAGVVRQRTNRKVRRSDAAVEASDREDAA